MSHDPRVDPWPGDRVQLPNIVSISHAVGGAIRRVLLVDNGRVTYVSNARSGMFVGHRTRTCSLKAWQHATKDAKILESWL